MPKRVPASRRVCQRSHVVWEFNEMMVVEGQEAMSS